MSRFQQNIMYVIIILLIFIVCVYFFIPNKKYETRGIFLPRYNLNLSKVDTDSVKVYSLDYKSDIKGSIGLIRVATHVENQNDFQNLCDRNVKKAIFLAAKNGANEIKYICLYPEDHLDSLSNVSLQAYAFRNL